MNVVFAPFFKLAAEKNVEFETFDFFFGVSNSIGIFQNLVHSQKTHYQLLIYYKSFSTLLNQKTIVKDIQKMYMINVGYEVKSRKGMNPYKLIRFVS